MDLPRIRARIGDTEVDTETAVVLAHGQFSETTNPEDGVASFWLVRMSDASAWLIIGRDHLDRPLLQPVPEQLLSHWKLALSP